MFVREGEPEHCCSGFIIDAESIKPQKVHEALPALPAAPRRPKAGPLPGRPTLGGEGRAAAPVAAAPSRTTQPRMVSKAASAVGSSSGAAGQYEHTAAHPPPRQPLQPAQQGPQRDRLGRLVPKAGGPKQASRPSATASFAEEQAQLLAAARKQKARAKAAKGASAGTTPGRQEWGGMGPAEEQLTGSSASAAPGSVGGEEAGSSGADWAHGSWPAPCERTDQRQLGGALATARICYGSRPHLAAGG